MTIASIAIVCDLPLEELVQLSEALDTSEEFLEVIVRLEEGQLTVRLWADSSNLTSAALAAVEVIERSQQPAAAQLPGMAQEWSAQAMSRVA